MIVTIDKHIKLATGNQSIELTFLPAKELRIRIGIRHVAGHIDHVVYEDAWVGEENDSSPRGRLISTASGPAFPDSLCHAR